ncbi:hypothetical protein KI387_022289, partial [Taxus chinensis]
AGELAWLVKDNLPCKHLILSAEETFIKFLEPSSSSEDILELEPMVSYHRMLLHRLADIFCLAHESVGEGDDRHLIVERCQDSSIPAVLVSDVLEWQYGETKSQQAACQLLKRKIALPESHQQMHRGGELRLHTCGRFDHLICKNMFHRRSTDLSIWEDEKALVLAETGTERSTSFFEDANKDSEVKTSNVGTNKALAKGATEPQELLGNLTLLGSHRTMESLQFPRGNALVTKSSANGITKWWCFSAPRHQVGGNFLPLHLIQPRPAMFSAIPLRQSAAKWPWENQALHLKAMCL